MSTDTINRQTFEFTCKAEETAKKIQHTIESHTANQINHIISSCLSDASGSDDYLKIDKIEIDLGDITAYNFGSEEMLASFKEIFELQISKIQAGRYNTNNRGEVNNDPGNKTNNSAVIISQLQNELEMIESFILLGNVPWWVDKNIAPDLDSVIQKMIRQHPQALRQLLEEHAANTDVILRLFTQMKPATVSKITGIMPELSGTDPKQKFIYESMEQGIYSLSPLHIKRLKIILNKHPQASVERLRQFLVQLLMQFYGQMQDNKLPAEEKGLERLLLKLNVQELFFLISSSKDHGHANKRRNKREIVNLVNNLSVFEAELLLFELSRFFNKHHLINSSHNTDNYFGSEDQTVLSDFTPVDNAGYTVDETLSPPTGTNYHAAENSFSDTGLSRGAEVSMAGKRNIIQPPRPGEADEKDALLYNEAYSKEPPGKGDPAINPVKKVDDIEPAQSPGKNENQVIKPALDEIDSTHLANDNEKQLSAAYEENRAASKVLAPITGVDDNNKAVPGTQDNENTGEEKQVTEFTFPTEPGLTQSKDEHPGLYKMIAFIMKRLNTSDAVIFHYLEQLGTKNLEQLAAVFKQHVRDHIEHKKTVRDLLEHPALFKNNILKVFAGLVPAKGQIPQGSFNEPVKKTPGKNNIPAVLLAKIQSSQSAFLSYLKHLPVKNLIIIKDIFQKGRFDTNNERDIVKRMLLKLPQENILFLKFLAELPEQEMEQLLSSEQQSALAGYTQEKKESKRFYDDGLQNHIYIENAGLCLLAVYLPGFFKQLGYLENGIFRNKAYAIRAIYVLQYITSGQSKNPEYLLQFNKLLCGFRIDDYITKSTRLSKKEISETGSLLESVIKNWKVLKNTSPEGLRESFLKRKGTLSESDSKWTLQVERKGYDVLLNSIPWGYGMIKLPWMTKFIQVEW